jgi:lipopolysaccharide export system permease protein
VKLLKTLDRYIFKEVALAWIAVTGVLLVILLFNQFSRVLAQAVENQYSSDVVLILLALMSLQNLSILMPVGLFLAIMLALGRLYHENEMAAMQACGIGMGHLYKPIGLLTAFVVLLLAYQSFILGPAAFGKAQQIRLSAIREAQLGNLEPGRFRSFSGGDVVFYAERVDDKGVLYNVFVERSTGPKVEVAVAARAEQRGAGGDVQTFVLYEGRRYEGIPGSAEFRLVQFSEHGIPVRLPVQAHSSGRRELIPTLKLLQSNNTLDLAELQWRISVPVMAVVLMFVAVPLSRLKPRQGRYGKIGLAILVCFLYMNLLNAGRVWLEQGIVPRFAGLWWVHALILALAGILYFRNNPVGEARTLVRA